MDTAPKSDKDEQSGKWSDRPLAGVGVPVRPGDGAIDSTKAPDRPAPLDMSDIVQGAEQEGEAEDEEGEQSVTQMLYEFTEDPESSNAAYVWSLFILLLILLGTITLIVETLPENVEDAGAILIFFIIESVCVGFFTVELVLRLIGWEFSIKFLQEPMTIIDMLAILPYYADLVIILADGLSPGSAEAAGNGNTDATRVLRLFRLIRIFRVFKLSRNSPTMQLAVKAVVASFDTLVLMVMILLFMVIFFGSIVYTFERGDWKDEFNEYRREHEFVKSPYTSIPEGMWWCLCTIMTVGYGDVFPTTDLGKFAATITIVCSIVILALPISVIGLNFSLMWSSQKRQKGIKSDPNLVSRSQSRLTKELTFYNQNINMSMQYLHKAKDECRIQLDQLVEQLEHEEEQDPQQELEYKQLLQSRLIQLKYQHFKMETLREKCLRLVPISSKDPESDDFSATGYFILLSLMQRAQGIFEWVQNTTAVCDHVSDDLDRMAQYINIGNFGEAESRGCFSALSTPDPLGSCSSAPAIHESPLTPWMNSAPKGGDGVPLDGGAAGAAEAKMEEKADVDSAAATLTESKEVPHSETPVVRLAAIDEQEKDAIEWTSPKADGEQL